MPRMPERRIIGLETQPHPTIALGALVIDQRQRICRLQAVSIEPETGEEHLNNIRIAPWISEARATFDLEVGFVGFCLRRR